MIWGRGCVLRRRRLWRVPAIVFCRSCGKRLRRCVSGVLIIDVGLIGILIHASSMQRSSPSPAVAALLSTVASDPPPARGTMRQGILALLRDSPESLTSTELRLLLRA